MPQNETRLAANQKFRETWLISENGRKIVEKRISKECGKNALDQIGKILDKQIDLSQKLTEDELKQIILFQEKIDREKEIVYHRPYIEGETLATRIKSGPMKTLDAIELILKIGKIVSNANKKGIIHGDLKPENIIIAQDSSVCIIDWDTMKINRKIGDAQHVTMTQEESAGTPEYMDPEQCVGKQADQQSDVYALGLILYAMLAGKTPYSEMKPLEILDKKHSEIENIASQYPDLQIDLMLASTIEEALRKERNYRIQTVTEFLEKIKNCSVDGAPGVLQPFRREETAPAVPIDNHTPQGKTTKYNFVLIGHSGAGKTVLAAGLYSYAGESFSVEADSPQTRKNADNLKTRLITHQWPDHTARGGCTDYSFFVFKNQKNVASICFPEYAGEDINQPRYCDNYLKNADAVALLLNPNILEKNDHERIDRMSKLKECITYLSRLPVVPPVAFLITASDRLETDYSDRRDEFEKYAKEIMVSLNAKKVCAKRFDVSVTGKLESQDRADLNPENIDAPFIWLLDQLEQQENKRNLYCFCKKFGWPAAIVLVVLCILLSVFFRRSKGKEDATAEVRTEQVVATVSEEPSPAKQPQSSAIAIAAESSADHTDEIKNVDANNISAVRAVVSKYKGYTKDQEALATLVDEMINNRFVKMRGEYDRMNQRDKNDWEKISALLKTTLKEIDSVDLSFEWHKDRLKDLKSWQFFIVNTFKNNAKSNIKSLANDVVTFVFEEGKNPYLEEIDVWFSGKMYDQFKLLFDNPYRDESFYIELNELAAIVKKDEFRKVGNKTKNWNSWCDAFSEWKKGNTKYDLVIEGFQAKVTYADYSKPFLAPISITKNGVELLAEYKPKLEGWFEKTTFESDYKKFESVDLKKTTSAKLGDYIHFQAKMIDQKGSDHEVDDFSFSFFPGIDSLDDLERPGTHYQSYVKLDISVYPSNMTFKQWKKENPLPQK